MEILYIIGFFVLLGLIFWIIDELRKFVETRRYKKKLKKLSPQLEAINTAELSSRLSEIRESYLSLLKLLQLKHKFSNEGEQVRTVDHFVQEHANYSRRKRKPVQRTYRRKYRRFRRY